MNSGGAQWSVQLGEDVHMFDDSMLRTDTEGQITKDGVRIAAPEFGLADPAFVMCTASGCVA
jgi:hypothetical protein